MLVPYEFDVVEVFNMAVYWIEPFIPILGAVIGAISIIAIFFYFFRQLTG